MTHRLASFMIAACLLCATLASTQAPQLEVATEKGDIEENVAPHPLSWWTVNPLRLDVSGDLMLGTTTPDGQPITARDFQVRVKVLPVGELAGRKILEVRTIIQPGPRVIAAGWAVPGGQPAEWKHLLVAAGTDRYLEFYALRYDQGELMKLSHAAIFGSGPDAFLGTYDPDTGNGGGCRDGYWWFDDKGPHEVDFSPLFDAVTRAIPANGTFTRGCWALHPKTMELDSEVQSKDAECHACGELGEVDAVFRIEHGAAKPVSIEFEPEKP